MNIAVLLEHRFNRTPEGAVWSQTMFGYPFWQRYLDVFEHVCVVARIREAAAPESGWKRADGERVAFAGLPYYVGPLQYASKYLQVRRAVCAAVVRNEAFILRVPGVVGSAAYRRLRADKRPFGLEVVGDPNDVFSPAAVKHPLRPFFRW